MRNNVVPSVHLQATVTYMLSQVHDMTIVARDSNCIKDLLPVPPLPLLKGMHHRSEFHGERVCFFKVGMSVILKKRVRFGTRYFRIFWKRGSIFSIFNSPFFKTRHFVEKGSFLSPQTLFPLCESQCFVE